MTCDQAVSFPIKTFSSGPTNSMRGANFLASWASGGPRKETALVVDVGGTTVCHMAIKREADIRLKWAYYSPQDSHAKQQPNINSVELGSISRCPMSTLSAWEVDPESEKMQLAR
jgi:N-methylhydantoinase A/oxoprolinase/acetone carboxylase beta subunit